MKNLHQAYSKKHTEFLLKIFVTSKSDVGSKVLLEILKYYTQVRMYTNHSCVILVTSEDSNVT